MPKRIPNLSEAILETAASLFSVHGYDAVDMKQVAAETGTSVGTLYNYYPSKPAIFIAVVRRWRVGLLEGLQGYLNSDLPRRDKILAVLGRLYDDVSGWHGIWHEFLRGREERSQFMELKTKNDTGHPWGLGPEELALLREFETLLTGKPVADSVARWAYLTITATLQLAARYPSSREENWKFIEEMVDKI